MAKQTLQILSDEYFEAYSKKLKVDITPAFQKLKKEKFTAQDFQFYTSVSSVFSSKIEGEEIDLDSYLKHKLLHIKFKPDYTKKTDDLFTAYEFAKGHPLNLKTLLKAHEILSKNLLPASGRGRIRTGPMLIMNSEGKIEYVAASPTIVKVETTKLFADINMLLHKKMSIENSFYFAALIHFVFVKIHPTNDGNGRTARLLEKWFLSEKLGAASWKVQSEKFYYKNLKTYYATLQTGLEYEQLNYKKCIPFLLMLSKSLTAK